MSSGITRLWETVVDNTCTYQDKGTSVAAVNHLVTITHSKVLPGFACIPVCAAYHSTRHSDLMQTINQDL